MSHSAISSPRWFSNTRVQEFYATALHHAKRQPSTSRMGASHCSGSIQRVVDKSLSNEKAQPSGGSEASSEAVCASTRDEQHHDNHDSIRSVQPTMAKTGSSKPIPRKLFKAIKKKLQKRERRRLVATGERAPNRTLTPYVGAQGMGVHHWRLHHHNVR
ncbi:hypothetical protein B0O80DRAFT_493069 [Mortierella sp. GBAus27b]|nr:hypothetical protein B0O80DRAFT_493069 [Mortierella sp. GBAus27b]